MIPEDTGAGRRWIAALCLFCAVAIALLSWAGRFAMNPDGVSYLDMADRLLHGDLHTLIHPYWSPLYPSLLAIALRIFSPGPSREVLVVHLANCFIGWSALASFTFFVWQWSDLRGNGRNGQNSTTTFRLRTGFAYALFLWVTCQLAGLASVTPDLCAATLVYWIAGLCCRMSSPRGGQRTPVWLGIALSLGYFAKASLLPLGVALLVLLAIPRCFAVSRRFALATPALIFAGAIVPQILLMSLDQHRLTFSDAGRLNYAWHVQRATPIYAGWSEHTVEAGNPIHPPRVLGMAPTVLEFKDTVPGTYPLWYDPAYFYEGLQLHFEWRKQVAGLAESWRRIVLLHGGNLIPLAGGVSVLCLLTLLQRRGIDLAGGWLILWTIASIGLFAMVVVVPRYLAPFLALFWLAVYDTIPPGTGQRAFRAVVGAVAIWVAVPQLFSVAVAASRLGREVRESDQIVVARDLTRMGLRPGDEIATVGYPFSIYYARLAGLRIVANIGFRGGAEGGDYVSDTAQFRDLDESRLRTLEDELRGLGARAIISPDQGSVSRAGGWQPLAGTSYCVQILDSTRARM